MAQRSHSPRAASPAPPHPFDDPASLPSAGLSPSAEIARGLSRDDLIAAVAIRDWLLGDFRLDPERRPTVVSVGDRLNEAGVPVDRLTIVVDMLHAEHEGFTRIWERGRGVETRHFPFSADDRMYRRSPFYLAHQTGEWVDLVLAETPDDAFGIVPDLKAAGYTHYVCAPITYSTGAKNGVTFATRHAGGFSARDRAILRFILPAVTAVMEIRTAWLQLEEVLRTYVGADPYRAIMAGAIRRGQMSRIRAAILVADLRSYTALTFDRPAEAVVGALNQYFDCLVPPIERRGGEVLKYMGDGLLAIFRDEGGTSAKVAAGALAAAREGLKRLAVLDKAGTAAIPLQAGVALHHGEAAYGNVGSGVRLDFTVIGADVNIASRIAGLNRPLGEPLLISDAFARVLGRPTRDLGEHLLPGIPLALRLHRPAR